MAPGAEVTAVIKGCVHSRIVPNAVAGEMGPGMGV